MAQSKDLKFQAVTQALLKILSSSHLEITHSQVSRLSGVSRAWLYKYIGQTAHDLTQFAARQIAHDLLHLGGLPTEVMKDKDVSAEKLINHIFQASEHLFALSEYEKDIFKIYFKYLGTDTTIGKLIQQYEKQQIKNLSEAFIQIMNWEKQKALDLAEIILAIKFGISGRLASGAMSATLRKKDLNQRLKYLFRQNRS